ncbi:MAG: hypothetical protein HIU89_09125 [Proteobacteria bacterium]|nr:hypothetical protein [Pseudomonadota bacterium]
MAQAAEAILKEDGVLKLYGYSINLDERGEFYADVRDSASGESVYEFGSSKEGDYGAIWEIDDGYMKDKNDTQGLLEMLVQNGVVPSGSTLLPLAQAERIFDKAADAIGLGNLRFLVKAERDARMPAQAGMDESAQMANYR